MKVDNDETRTTSCFVDAALSAVQILPTSNEEKCKTITCVAQDRRLVAAVLGRGGAGRSLDAEEVPQVFYSCARVVIFKPALHWISGFRTYDGRFWDGCAAPLFVKMETVDLGLGC